MVIEQSCSVLQRAPLDTFPATPLTAAAPYTFVALSLLCVTFFMALIIPELLYMCHDMLIATLPH